MARLRALRRNVQLIEPGARSDAVREVSPDTYDRIVDMQGQAMQAQHAPGDMVIYHQLTGAPRRVSANVAVQHDLRKVVSYCTGCRQTFLSDEQVLSHIAHARQAPIIHKAAVPVGTSSGKFGCSACDGFDPYGGSQHHRVQAHIDLAQAAGRAHLHAEVGVIQQFGREPPVVSPVVQVHRNGDTPVASQEEWRPRRRRRHRNRGRKEVRA